MDPIQSLYEQARAMWRLLLPGSLERGFAGAALYLVALYVVVLAIETAYGARTRNYRTRDFGHDVAYYFYYRSGFHRLFVTAAFFAALSAPLSFLDLKLLTPLPPLAQLAIGLVVTDFSMYWLHRAQHHFRFLWAFHSMHHSQEHLTFASYLRFHPVEVFAGECLSYVVLRILGVDLAMSIAVLLLVNFVGEITHTQIPWRLGPLYRVIVTPTFHAYHHSPDAAVHDRNYGGLFSFWDYLFGTAVRDGTPLPARYGLDDVKPRSLWGTLVMPFELLRRFYGPSVKPAALPGPGGEPEGLDQRAP